jgi:hypothetical protein
MQLVLSAGGILATVVWGLQAPASLAAVFDQALAFSRYGDLERGLSTVPASFRRAAA